MSLSRLLPAIILLCFLSGCVAASQTLSGSSTEYALLPLSETSWNIVQAGVTTQEEVQLFLGNPTDIQVSTTIDGIRESWAYVATDAARQPFQYLPLLGALSIHHRDDRTPFAISFSPDGVVDGLTVSRVHALGNAAYDFASYAPVTPTPLYGMKNPLAQPVSR